MKNHRVEFYSNDGYDDGYMDHDDYYCHDDYDCSDSCDCDSDCDDFFDF